MHALYQLAISPECIRPLREEALRATQEDGYTSHAIFRLRKLDSFVKETMRLHGVTSGAFASLWPLSLLIILTATISRVVLRDYTLLDGTFLPAGTYLMCNTGSIHHDEANYQNASGFEPFRFVGEGPDSRVEEKEKANATSTSLKFLAFSHGKHSWYVYCICKSH